MTEGTNLLPWRRVLVYAWEIDVIACTQKHAAGSTELSDDHVQIHELNHDLSRWMQCPTNPRKETLLTSSNRMEMQSNFLNLSSRRSAHHLRKMQRYRNRPIQDHGSRRHPRSNRYHAHLCLLSSPSKLSLQRPPQQNSPFEPQIQRLHLGDQTSKVRYCTTMEDNRPLGQKPKAPRRRGKLS